MEGKIFLNGEPVAAEQARISIFDLGFLYGVTFIEAIRTFRHKPFKLEEHLTRLIRSFRAAGLKLPLGREELRAAVMRPVNAYLSEIEEDNDCWACINVTPGETFPHPMVRHEDMKPTVAVYAVALPYGEYVEFYWKGIRAVISTVRNIPPQSLSPRMKVRSRMHYFMANAETRKADPKATTLLLDLEGNLTESSGANIFLVNDGVLYTPTTRNILVGISRQTVLELASELGIPAVETDIQLLDIRNAEEAFFTTTSYCILPIRQIDREPPLEPIPGPITARLLSAWSDMVGVDIVAQAGKFRHKPTH